MFKPTPHPILRLPSAAETVAMGSHVWGEAMAKREELIAREKADPFTHGWEPPIWRVCDALLGFPWVDPVWAASVRDKLGFKKRVKTLLINGGNRAGKSQYASKRTMRILRSKYGARGWSFHSKMPMSIDYQQPLFFNYLPPELRGKDIRTRKTYIAYKQKTGFSEAKFVLPAPAGENGSDHTFLAYEMDKEVIEGGNLDIIWPDELVPCDWVETLEFRIAEKDGYMIITFTPVRGYNETVKMFQDGATVVMESIGFLCPDDGGPADPARALGLTEAEYAEILAAAEERRPSLAPQSVPQDCAAWLTGGTGQPEIPAGRTFARLPRVMKCADLNEERAVVFFHSADNPYGNPKGVLDKVAGKSLDFVKERFYGIATKNMTARFPKFNTKVHVIPPEQIPKHGTNTQITDPCSGRNFFMSWFRRTPEGIYLYREWPGDYAIEHVGHPGPWALPDGKKPDGRMGPAQSPFGFGNIAYKREIARLEGWHDADPARNPKPPGMSDNEFVASWDQHNGAAERMTWRKIDSRFASTPRSHDDKPKTLITEFEEINLFFEPTPGDDIDEGIQLINDALDYDPKQDISFHNKPKLFISAACVNTIFALQTWVGKTAEGRNNFDGATKDPIDNLRYYVSDDLPYLGDGTDEPDGGEEAGDEDERMYREEESGRGGRGHY